MIEIDLIVESLNELCRFNRTLFKETVSEQTICASLSQCILLVKREKYPRFNDYYVDVEYNRGYSGKKKAVQMFDNQTKEYRLKNVICDLVIHKRGEGGATPENLIAIEMKKTSDCEKKVSNKTESEYFNNRREADIANDCRLNKIDLIIVKSISRFSRNVLDFISIYRELKALTNPVGVYIEDLNINTLDTTSETLLLMLSVVAQAESEQKSEAITWSIIERFKKGLPIIPTHNFLGFTKDRFGKVVIEESEAEIVRFIYKNFLEGVRAVDIASLLNEANIPTVAGNKWKSPSIYRVLRNEKYFGLVIMQKTFTVDCFTHKKKVNHGEKPQYLLRNGLPAIVSEEDWDLVQELLLNPKKGFKKKTVKNIEKPKTFVSTIKSGLFKGFIVIDAKWSKEEVAKVLSKGEHQ